MALMEYCLVNIVLGDFDVPRTPRPSRASSTSNSEQQDEADQVTFCSIEQSQSGTLDPDKKVRNELISFDESESGISVSLSLNRTPDAKRSIGRAQCQRFGAPESEPFKLIAFRASSSPSLSLYSIYPTGSSLPASSDTAGPTPRHLAPPLQSFRPSPFISATICFKRHRRRSLIKEICIFWLNICSYCPN